MAYPENALTLDILPLSADTARLVRVYGTEPCIALPGTLPAPEGGSFAVTELGDYCFSEKPRSLPAADKTCRYTVEPDGTVQLTRAFGQTVGAGTTSTLTRPLPVWMQTTCTRCVGTFSKS